MADNKPNPRTPVLNLDAVASGPLVTIHGQAYEIQNPLSMSLGQIKRVRQLGIDIDALESKADLTDDDDARLSQLLGALCGQVLIAPADVVAKLTDLQKGQVLGAFMELRSMTRAAAEAASPSTGRKSSRASRGSSGGRRKSGSGTFRSLSSTRT